MEKFIGDAAMAIFGAPVAHEDDPERVDPCGAWRSASGPTDEGRRGADRDQHRRGAGHARTPGRRPGRRWRRAMWSTPPRGSSRRRRSNGILVGEQTYRATERAIEYSEAEPVEAKGKAEPVPAWEVVRGTRARRGRPRPRRRARRSPPRGRRCSRTRSRARWASARPQLVTLVGVPGIGKSRLVLELYERDRAPPRPDLLAARALPAVRRGRHVLGARRDGQGAGRHPRRRRRGRGGPEARGRRLRPLGRVASAAARRACRRVRGRRRRCADEAFAAWRRFFEGLADERPLVLVFEDLHWADDHLLDFVDHLVDWSAGVPLLVVCTARPELLTRRPDWGGGKPNALTRLALRRSRDEDTARLLARAARLCSAGRDAGRAARAAPAATRSTPRSSPGCCAIAASDRGAPRDRPGPDRGAARPARARSRSRCSRTRP